MIGVPSIFSVIRIAAALARVLPTFAFRVDENAARRKWNSFIVKVVYYKSRKRDLAIRLMNESRYDERLNTRVQETTCLTYTGLHDKTN